MNIEKILFNTLLIVPALLVGARRASAQTPADSTRAAPATTTAPVVAASTNAAGGLPSSEFETYNVSGRGIRYTAALTGIYSTGTVERVYLTTSHTGNLALGRHWLLPAALNFSYGKQDGALRERELLGLLTPAYKRGRLKYYALAEGEQSNLRAIARRLVGGVGAGYQLYLDTLRNEVSVSQFFLYEHTQYLAGLLREVPRASTRLKLRLSKGPVVFTSLTFYQPSLQDFANDYRLNSTSSLSFSVSRHLALTAAYTYSYESVAVENRSSLNTNLTVGFTYSTGK
ncbi:DUF481 domain-containing protein [Hymenobacter baengnokdamensis]|uniref:DUF481 domain-containing protein n=1 Tax=Hymenobacter baengnokdamensis TaxID=2615203 RepID=UPI001247FA7B|nr:DUF481 domain-containing protein [Hymenobacter baengnokdamensis]